MIRVLIVDDQPSVRKGLRMRLAAEADLFGGMENPALAKRFPSSMWSRRTNRPAGSWQSWATSAAPPSGANQEVIPLPMFWLLKRYRPVKVLIIERAKQYA